MNPTDAPKPPASGVDSRQSSPNAVCPAALFADVTIRAIAALEDPASSPRHVAQAAMILNNNIGRSDEHDLRILTAVNRRLTELAGSEEALTAMVDVEFAFAPATIPTESNNATTGIIWKNLPINPVQACVTLELLDLFAQLRSDSKSSEGIQSIVPTLVNSLRPNPSGERSIVTWPELKNVTGGTGVFLDVNEKFVRPADIVKFAIDSHPAVIEYRAKTGVTPM